MSVSVASSIAVITAALKVRLTFTATTANAVRVWCSAAPIGSKLRTELDKSNAARVHVFDADSGKGVDYSFDAPGAYTVIASEIQLGSSYGGSYQYDVDAAPSEQLLSETSVTLYVANGLKATLGIGGDTAELDIYVANTSICQTLLSVHGTATPGIQKGKSPKARTAATAGTVTVALGNLAGFSAQGALGDLGAAVNNLIDCVNAHLASDVFHASADGQNLIDDVYRDPGSPEGLKRSLSQLLKSLSSHIRNDSLLAPEGTGGHPFHVISSRGVVDWASLPLFDSSSTLSEHVRALADVVRAYEAHRVSVAHLTPDNVNFAQESSLLIKVHRAFLAELAALNPTPPVTDNAAKTTLVHGAGFEEI